MKERFIIKILSAPPRTYFSCLASSDGDYFTTTNILEANRFLTRQDALDTLDLCARPGVFVFEIRQVWVSVESE